MHYSFLPHRGLLRLSGKDTIAFLQGLVSNDVSPLAQGGVVYAALLTPQGKFLHDFFLVQGKDGIYIDCDRQRLPDLLQRLKMYRLRSEVTIDPLPEAMTVAALWAVPDNAAPAAENILLFRDARVEAMGWRMIGGKDDIDAWCAAQSAAPSPAQAYEMFRLASGVPEGASDLVADKSFLLQYGFEDLHGVSFSKGCYVGQEVTARSKHLGQIRKFIYRVESPDSPLPPPGTPVYIGDALAGEMRSGLGKVGLALLNVEDVEKARASHTDLQSGGIAIKASLPAWVKTRPSAV